MRKSVTSSKRLLILGQGFLVVLLLATGCASETLFRSNFDTNPIGQPPAQAQAVGTAGVHGPQGSVVVVAPPVTPSGRWVRISRPNGPLVAGLQGKLSQFRGEGTYVFSTTLFIPQGSGVATVQFEPFHQPVQTPGGFLHLDFLPDNRVRIGDDPDTTFGTFPQGQPFIVQVTLNIQPSPTARIVLSGAGASGVADHTVHPAFQGSAQQFGAVRIWMGFPHTGSFDATNIVVRKEP